MVPDQAPICPVGAQRWFNIFLHTGGVGTNFASLPPVETFLENWVFAGAQGLLLILPISDHCQFLARRSFSYAACDLSVRIFEYERLPILGHLHSTLDMKYMFSLVCFEEN